MSCFVLRPPLVYGPRVRGNFLALWRAVERGVPLPLGRIANRRNLLYVGNLVHAIIALLDAPQDEAVLANVRAEASALTTKFPVYT